MTKPEETQNVRPRKTQQLEKEGDPVILQRRQKQIDYGYNTVEYAEYRRQVPKSDRTKYHPSTPDKTRKYSRRGFDAMVRIWRKSLHFWGPQKEITLKEELKSEDEIGGRRWSEIMDEVSPLSSQSQDDTTSASQ